MKTRICKIAFHCLFSLLVGFTFYGCTAHSYVFNKFVNPQLEQKGDVAIQLFGGLQNYSFIEAHSAVAVNNNYGLFFTANIQNPFLFNNKYFGLYYDGGLIHYSRNEKYNLEFILGFGRGDIEFNKTSYSMFVPFVRRFVDSEYFKVYGQLGAYEIKKSAKKPNRKSSSCLLLRTNYCHFINNFALEQYSADRGSGYTFEVTDTLFFSKMQNTGFFIIEPGFVYTTGGRFIEMKFQTGYSTILNLSLPPRDMKYDLFKYKHFNFCFGIAFKIKGKQKKIPLELN